MDYRHKYFELDIRNLDDQSRARCPEATARNLDEKPRAKRPAIHQKRAFPPLPPLIPRPARGYRQKAAACLATCVSALPVTVPACIAAVSVMHTSHRVHLVSCPSRSSRYLCVVVFGSTMPGQSHSFHPFIYGSPASPLLSRAPITKCISSCEVNSSTSTSTETATWIQKWFKFKMSAGAFSF